MIFIVALFVLFFGISALFIAFVLPVWSMIDCGISDRSRISKIGWIIFIFIFGFLASLIYVFGESKNKVLKVLYLSFFGLIFIFGICIFWVTEKVAHDAVVQIHRVYLKTDKYAYQLTPEQIGDFKQTLTFVSDKIQQGGWQDFGRRYDYIDIADLIDFVSQDKIISDIDYFDIKELADDIKNRKTRFFEAFSDNQLQKTLSGMKRNLWKK